MEPVPPALRQWRLSHRTPGRPRRRSSISARWVVCCPQASRGVASPHKCVAVGAPAQGPRRRVPTACPHSPLPGQGSPTEPSGEAAALAPSWAQSLVARAAAGPCPALARARHTGGRECLGLGPAHPHLLAAGGPSASHQPPGRVTAGRLTHTRQHLGWDGGGSLDPRGPLPVEAGSRAVHRPRPTTERVHRHPAGCGAPALPPPGPGFPRQGCARPAITAGVPSVAQLPRTVGAVA